MFNKRRKNTVKSTYLKTITFMLHLNDPSNVN